MGQEIGISPLQLASLISTIANDGVRVPPRIVRSRRDDRAAESLHKRSPFSLPRARA
jgi:cell division protein FtsI/penicillin-binding protein 2